MYPILSSVFFGEIWKVRFCLSVQTYGNRERWERNGITLHISGADSAYLSTSQPVRWWTFMNILRVDLLHVFAAQ